MGYTHYWEHDPETPRPIWDAALSDVRAIMGHFTVAPLLAGGDGTGPAEAEGSIVFNGRGPDLQHETFFLATDPDCEEYRHWSGTLRSRQGKSRHFSFCKTAQKPYDVAVVACLAAMQDRLRGYIEVSSDGGASEWEEGVTLASRILGRIVRNPLTVTRAHTA